MSYPYTKPQSRYGFRRSWNDPRTGLVGSGPGRPLRRYATDPEVGLPQLGPGLGATQETPVSEGIFNVGPAAGFTRGVFTPDPPYATPRYIANMPQGVSGMGAFGGATSCGIPELTKLIVSKFPTVKVSLSGTAKMIVGAAGFPTSFTFTPAAELVQPIVDSVLSSVGGVLAPYAKKGANALADFLASKLATPVANAIVAGAGVPDSVKTTLAPAIKGLVNNTLRSQLVGVAKDMMSCLGVEEPKAPPFDPTRPQAGPYMCIANGYVPIAIKPGEIGYNPGLPMFRCSKTGATAMMEAEMFKAPVDQTVDFNKSWYAAKDALEAGMSTKVADIAKCAQAGGQWYPGGADCLVDSAGSLYSCQAPTSATHKRYFCVPPGTPGATAATPSALSASGKSNLPLILGAAAIAALLITRL